MRSLGEMVLGLGAPLSARGNGAGARPRRPARGARSVAAAAQRGGVAAGGPAGGRGRLPAGRGGRRDRPGGRGRLQAVRAVRDQPGRRVLRPAGSPGPGQAPSARHADADRGAGRGPRDRRGRRALAPPDRGAGGRGMRALRAPLRRGSRIVARDRGRRRGRAAGLRASERVPAGGRAASGGARSSCPRSRAPEYPRPRLDRVDRGRNRRNSETGYGEGIRNQRARQRALCIAAAPGEPDLAELRELLRTAGVAVAGEMVQRRATARTPTATSARASSTS